MTSAEHEEYGPCPYCTRGFYVEHGDPDHPSTVAAPGGPTGSGKAASSPTCFLVPTTPTKRGPIPDDARAWLKSISIQIKEIAA